MKRFRQKRLYTAPMTLERFCIVICFIVVGTHDGRTNPRRWNVSISQGGPPRPEKAARGQKVKRFIVVGFQMFYRRVHRKRSIVLGFYPRELLSGNVLPSWASG